jgi:hypothetical protein
MAGIKNAQQYTDRLDKIAEELQSVDPVLAMELDKISDVIEGRREASTLTFDADEAKYMQGRFNNDVRQRDGDEPYMDKFNENNFEQVTQARKNPTPIKVAAAPYQKA